MNERIRELAKQAGIDWDDWQSDEDGTLPRSCLENLVDLIVQDIMTLLPEDCQVEDGQHLYWVLKDRYGVEL